MSAVTPCLNGGLLANRLLKRAGTSGQSQTGAEVGAVPGRWRRVGGRRGQPCAASSITAGMGMHGQSIARTGGRSGSSRGLRLRGWVVVDNSGAVETDTAEAATLDEALVAGAAMAAPVTPTSVPAIDVPLATPLTTAPTAAAAAAADGLKTKVSGKATGEASAHAGAATGRAVASQLRGVGAARGGLLGCDRVVDVSTAALPRLQRLDKGSKFPVLFYAPEMEDLARKVVKEEVGESTVELGSINWRNFPDGFPDLFVNDAYGVRDRHVAFLASFHSPEVIFEQISIIYSLPKMFVASFTLILPFFPTGTSERVENEGEIATAVTLARILSHIPPSRGGPCSTLIFDIHALQERFYFGDNVLPCFESGIPLLLARLAQCDDAANIVIAYPDEGAWKRFHGFFKGMEEVVCTKVRETPKPCTLNHKPSAQNPKR